MESVEDEFMGLVDAYVAQYPIRTSALSERCIKFAAGKLLLLQSGHAAKVNISDKGAHRLVAVLLLLFLYEGLGHNTPVLGLRPHKLYELIEHIVRESRITREELLAEIMEVEVNGSRVAMDFVQHHAIDPLFSQHRHGVGGSALEMVPEEVLKSTQLDESSKEAMNIALYVRLFLPPAVGLALVVGDAGDFWDFVTGWNFMQYNRGILFSITTTMAFVFNCSVYPDSLGSAGGRRFVAPFVVCACGSGMVNLIMSVAYASPSMYGGAAAECRPIHIYFACAGCLNFGINIILNIFRTQHYSWGILRVFLSFDGIIFVTFNCLLRHFGPPVHYPPGNMPFGAAILRGSTTLALALLGTPTNRNRVAKYMNDFWGTPGASKLGPDIRHVFEGDEDTIAETAKVDELLEITEQIRSQIRRRLAFRLTSVRIGLIAVALIYTTMATWHKFSVPLSFAGVIALAMAMMASSFPNDPTSPAGRRLLLPVFSVCAVVGFVSALLGFVERRHARMVSSGASLLAIHFALFALVTLTWTTAAVLCAQGRLSWTAIRSVCCADGLAYCICFGLTHFLGLEATPHLPKIDSDLKLALTRGFAPIVVAALMTSWTRQRIAAAADVAGWNHVTLNLAQLFTERSLADGLSDGLSRVSLSNIDQMTEDSYKNTDSQQGSPRTSASTSLCCEQPDGTEEGKLGVRERPSARTNAGEAKAWQRSSRHEL